MLVGNERGPRPSRWNHNIHYHGAILKEVPEGARTALDVGCGNGLLTRELQRVVPEVVGIDADERVLEQARRACGDVEWVLGDVLTHDFDRRFDVVVSVAVLHHFPDLRAALMRLAALTAPGGVLAIIGVARATRLWDRLIHVPGLFQHWWFSARYGFWEHTAPTVWPPLHDYTTVRRVATELLPGMVWRRLPLWRYSLIWHRPVMM